MKISNLCLSACVVCVKYTYIKELWSLCSDNHCKTDTTLCRKLAARQWLSVYVRLGVDGAGALCTRNQGFTFGQTLDSFKYILVTQILFRIWTVFTKIKKKCTENWIWKVPDMLSILVLNWLNYGSNLAFTWTQGVLQTRSRYRQCD